jgi:hypothetical protein
MDSKKDISHGFAWSSFMVGCDIDDRNTHDVTVEKLGGPAETLLIVYPVPLEGDRLVITMNGVG